MSKSKCILNMNNGSNNILFKAHLLDENSTTLSKDRAHLFYLICIPLRILIACFILYLYFIKNDKTQSYLCLIFALISFISFMHLLLKPYLNKECKQWWSNGFEIFLSFTAVIISLFCYFKKRNDCMLYISIIFFISIVTGLIQSFIIKPF